MPPSERTPTALSVATTCAALLLIAFGLQAVIHWAMGAALGAISVWAGFALLGIACWRAGSSFRRAHLIAAGLIGGVLSFAYVYLDWLLVRYLLLDVLHKPGEVASWAGVFFSVVAWPVSIIGGAVAAIASYRVNMAATS